MNKAVMLFMCFVAYCSRGQATTNVVTREIYYQNGDVWVADSVCLATDLCYEVPSLFKILDAKTHNAPNLHQTIDELLKGEDLRTVKREVEIKNSAMDLRILSEVQTDNFEPVRLHWFSTMAGLSITTSNASGEFSNPEMTVYSGSGGWLLWFPDTQDRALPPDLAVPSFVNLDYCFNTFVAGPWHIAFHCTLKTADREEVLVDWKTGTPTPNAPDSDFLKRLGKEHPISGNDLQRIFTNLKLAKSGYYAIDVGGFTNRPPLRVSDTAADPLDPAEMEARFIKAEAAPVHPEH